MDYIGIKLFEFGRDSVIERVKVYKKNYSEYIKLINGDCFYM